MRQQKVGLVILAGGDGTRLGFEGPKGCFFVPGLEKSLFEALMEKARRAKLPCVAVMTSRRNHDQVITFFREHDYFGFEQERVHFFQQASQPMTTLEGEALDASAPCGNGDVFAAFKRAGLDKTFKEAGACYVQVAPVDNPLAMIAQEEMIEAHEAGVELVVYAVKKVAGESVGLLVAEPTLKVIEYTEEGADREGALGYTGLFSMTLNAFEKSASEPLGWHQAVKVWQGQKVIKREKFVFDAFCSIASFKVLTCDRQKEFAPIKGAQDVYKYTDVIHN